MDGLPLILLVLGALAVTAVSRRLRLPAPLALVVVGLAISATPGIPDYQLDPNLVLYRILPPLLYSAALDSSTIQVRANIRSIALLAVGPVLFTTACVGLVAWWLVRSRSFQDRVCGWCGRLCPPAPPAPGPPNSTAESPETALTALLLSSGTQERPLSPLGQQLTADPSLHMRS